MLATLCHEPFYTSGVWIDEPSGVYVGWVARRNSFSEAMPLHNEQGHVSLVFSGEEFPEPGTVCGLRARGHAVELEGPSYLIHLYEEDPSFPKNLNGRFHGLLTDRNRGTATLFNDRYGLHRVYYHESKDALYFAAEAKAILEVRPELRSADPRGLGEFVACGCVLGNRTLFKGIQVLPPGSAWTFRNGSIESKASYFLPQEWEDQAALEPEAYYRELRTVFARNLPRYFSGQQKVGMSLTGGLDTRAIVAWHKAPPGSLPCYTFGGMFRECRDVRLARKVAGMWGQPHEVIPVGEEFLARFARYAERTVYLTDGCCDVAHAPDLHVNELAARIAPVRMTGNYGDQVLRGQRVFRPVEPMAGLFCPDFLSYVDRAKATFAGLLAGNPLSFVAFRQNPWHYYGLLALEQTQLSLRTPFLDNDLVRTAFRSPDAAFTSNEVRERLIADGNPAFGRLRTDLGFGGKRGTLGGWTSRHLHGFTMKAEYAYDYGMPQWLARADHMLAELHPERLFLGRHKFYHFRVWYRDALSGYVRETLLDPRALCRPYLERGALETVVRGHLRGDRNHTTAIHKALTLELFHRLFLDSE
jgi:asparagine synthase (glutamine-hydrolysing)